MFVIADQRFRDVVMVQELLRMASVFARDEVKAEGAVKFAESKTPSRRPGGRCFFVTRIEAYPLPSNRPAAWASIMSQTPGRLHPAQAFRALRPYVERDPDTVLICDGGFLDMSSSLARAGKRFWRT